MEGKKKKQTRLIVFETFAQKYAQSNADDENTDEQLQQHKQ